MLEKEPCNGGSRHFLLEISNLKMHPEAADLQEDDLKASVEANPSQTDREIVEG